MKAVTLIKTLQPETVGKSYRIVEGKLVKQAVADVWEGLARTWPLPDAAAMVELLAKTTASQNLVICNGVFRGAGDEPFHIMTEKRFRAVVEGDGANYAEVLAAGVLYRPTRGSYKGKLVGARKNELQEPSAWVLLDADEPKGFPDAWGGLTFQQRLELLEPYAPGLSTAERVELRGSSARVVRGGDTPGEPSHGWVCCDDPGDVARAAVALQLHATGGGTYFDSPRHDRATGTVIGAMARTSIDLAPWHRGRLNFDTAPTLDETAVAEGYRLADAGIAVVNPGGGLFRPGGVALVTKATTRAYREKTGHTIRVSSTGTSARQTNVGQLTLATPVEVRGEVRSLGEWADHMTERGLPKLRCEAPFRDSSSEAAFIGWGHDGPFVWDTGLNTKYVLAPDTGDDFDDLDAPDPDDAFGDDFDDFDDTPDPEDGMTENYENREAQSEAAEPGAGASADASADAGGGDPDTDDFDPDEPLTPADVKAADISTPEGVRIVDTFRDQQLAKLNNKIGFAMVEGKGVIVRVGANGIGELGVQFIGIDAERNRLANQVIPFVQGGKDPVLVWRKIFPYWLEWKNRRSYDGIVFNPRRDTLAERRLPRAARHGRDPLNLFVGTAWGPEDGDCKMILDHIHEVLCGGQAEATRYCLNWMARMVKEPESPAETVLVFRSGQGTGKNTVTNIFRRYFGAHGIELTNDKDLTGFNDHLATSIFVSLNEACWGGNRQSEGTLKSLITEREISVERKYVPRFKIRNRTHLIVSSNNDWAIPVGHDDRRFVVFNPSHHRVNDRAYFSALYAHIEGGGDRAFIAWLLRRVITGFDPRELPTIKGSIKLEQKLQSANSVAKWIMWVLREGGLAVNEEEGGGSGRTRAWLDLSAQPITTEALYHEYRATLGADRPETPELFGRKLREILGDTLTPTRPRAPNYRPLPRTHFGAATSARPCCYRFSDLDQVRAAFAKYIGEDIEW